MCGNIFPHTPYAHCRALGAAAIRGYGHRRSIAADCRITALPIGPNVGWAHE